MVFIFIPLKTSNNRTNFEGEAHDINSIALSSTYSTRKAIISNLAYNPSYR